MAKRAKVRTELGQWQDLASATTDLTAYSTTAQMNTAISAAQGMVYITGTTFSTAASVIFDNCFTSTYDNYRININCTASSVSGGAALIWYGRTSGSDITSNYGSQFLRAYTTTVSAFAQSQGDLGGIASGYPDYVQFSVDMFSPKLSGKTVATTTSFYTNGLGQQNLQTTGSFHTGTNQFDGIKILTGSGTFSGTIRIYGYKNS
jgi:hypothetical protein